jgi:hypothetical protein
MNRLEIRIQKLRELFTSGSPNIPEDVIAFCDEAEEMLPNVLEDYACEQIREQSEIDSMSN